MSKNRLPRPSSGQPTAALIRWGLVLIFVIVTVTAGVVTFLQVRQLVAASELLPTFTLGEDEKPAPENVIYEPGQTLPTWSGTRRITILLLGIDEREIEEGPWRTDTMMLLTLDPVTMLPGILSIPRDLWVSIPGNGEDRINTAHFWGDVYDYPGGGPALAVETVEYNLGVPVDYYVRVNFKGFVKLVDEIGGIDINVKETIDDPEYPDYNNGYDPLYIEAGQHHFDGELALKYARTRHSSAGDFGRADRQQEVMLAIFNKVSDPANFSRLVTRAPELFKTLENSVQTNLTLEQIIALANLARTVDRSKIRFGIIDQTCTQFATTPEGWQILIPLREPMRKVRDYVFGLTGTDDRSASVAEESATISVLNGTTTEGLAGATAQHLQAQGVPVALYANADRQDYLNSLVILNRDKSATAAEIIELLGLPQSALVHGDNPTAEYDIVIILGADYSQGAMLPSN